MYAGLFTDVADGILARPSRAVRAFGGEGIEDVHHGEDAGGEGDLLAFEPLGVAGAIPFFVVAVGDVEGGVQEGDGGEQLVGEGGVLAHEGPFVIGEGGGLEQDGVWDGHLADVVEQGAAAQVDELVIGEVQGLGEGEGHLGDALGVAFGFFIAQFEGVRPALEGGVVGELEFAVRALQVVEEGGVVDGDGGLGGEGVEQVEPIWGGGEGGAVVDFEDALDLVFGDEGDGGVGDEAFEGFELFWAWGGGILEGDVREEDDLSGEGGFAGESGADAQGGGEDGVGAEA